MIARLTAFGAAVLLAALFFTGDAAAQGCTVRCQAAPHDAGNPALSAQAAMLDIGSVFLQRLSALQSFRTAASAANNPQGGGADTPSERYRTWLEGYGLSSGTNPQGEFAGDRRRTSGVVAGAGMTVAPGVTLGLSADRSRIDVDVTGGTQGGRIDLTQIGAIASFENGPWNVGATVVHGFADVSTFRYDAGTSRASYGAKLWAFMAEVSYFLALPHNSRFVPKVSFDWTRSHTDAFTETGGDTPATATAVFARRVRVMAGAELGHSWLLDRTIMDFSVYGRLVDNLTQNIGTIQVIDAVNQPQFVTGIVESKFGMDAGATLSAKLTDTVRIYAVYDGRFRGNFTSNGGTVGAEFRF